jgi:hypothetical protein
VRSSWESLLTSLVHVTTFGRLSRVLQTHNLTCDARYSIVPELGPYTSTNAFACASTASRTHSKLQLANTAVFTWQSR